MELALLYTKQKTRVSGSVVLVRASLMQVLIPSDQYGLSKKELGSLVGTWLVYPDAICRGHVQLQANVFTISVVQVPRGRVT